MSKATVINTIDAECLAFQLPDTQDYPCPSIVELQELEKISDEPLRVIKIHKDDNLVGLAICYVEPTQIHGVRVTAYRPFGYKLHDYNCIYARDAKIFNLIFEHIIIDAKACKADVVSLDSLFAKKILLTGMEGGSGAIQRHYLHWRSQFLLEQGVTAEALIFDDQANNTHREAISISNLFGYIGYLTAY